MSKRIVCWCAVVVVVAAANANAQKLWTTNMVAAMRKAKAEDKDLLLNFTGSDWCHWCCELDREVFDTVAFRRQVPKHFISVTLDFPADESRQDAKLAKQNHNWLRKLCVDGFPTVVLCDSNARPYAMMGYEEGGAQPYLKKLNAFRRARVKRDLLFAEARQIQGSERARKLDEALRLIEDPIVAKFYGEEVEEVLKLAKDDKLLASRYAAIQLVGQQEAALVQLDELFMLKDADKAMKKLSELARLFPEKGQYREEFEVNRMLLLAQLGRVDDAVANATKLIGGHGHASELVADVRSIVLDTLLESGRHDELIRLTAEWKAADSFPADSEPELRLYRVQALNGQKKTAKAIAEARDLLKQGQLGAEADEWLRLFVEKKGDMPSFMEFVTEPAIVKVKEAPCADFWIGLAVDEASGDQRERLGLGEDTGLVVTRVLPSAPAGKSDLREGDVLATINEEPLNGFSQLVEAIQKSAGKSAIRFARLRDGKRKIVEVTPECRPEKRRESEVEIAEVPESWHQSYSEAAKVAERESKELVLFFSAKWCGPCQVVLKETVPDEAVQAELRGRVVAYIDVDSDEGVAVAETFTVNALPSYLFLSADKQEIGRAMGGKGVAEFLDILKNRGERDGFKAADVNGDGKVKMKEFRSHGAERLGPNMPLRKIFRKIDVDEDGALSEAEFEKRLEIVRDMTARLPAESHADPGKNFVPYPGGSHAVDDSRIYGALVHRYADLVKSERPWPKFALDAVPVAIKRPDFSSAKKCESVHDLARASLIIAGDDEERDGFFTGGAVLVSSHGLAITNYRTVENIAKTKLMAMNADGTTHRVVEVLVGNKSRDVALVRIEGDGFHAVRLAAVAPESGDDLVVMHHSEVRFFTYDRGYVMRYSTVAKQPWMEVSAEYASSASGCGVFNKKHELVGLVSSFRASDGPDPDPDASLEQQKMKRAVPLSAIESLWKK